MKQYRWIEKSQIKIKQTQFKKKETQENQK